MMSSGGHQGQGGPAGSGNNLMFEATPASEAAMNAQRMQPQQQFQQFNPGYQQQQVCSLCKHFYPHLLFLSSHRLFRGGQIDWVCRLGPSRCVLGSKWVKKSLICLKVIREGNTTFLSRSSQQLPRLGLVLFELKRRSSRALNLDTNIAFQTTDKLGHPSGVTQ